MSELTEALEHKAKFVDADLELLPVWLRPIVIAAGAYAEGRQIQYCETHESSAGLEGATVCDVKDGYPSATIGACSIVPMRLCAERTEET